MKKKEISASLLFLAVALLPALLVVIIYFFSTAKAASHNEAMENGYILALWFFCVVGVSRFFFDDEMDLRATSFFPIAIASLSITSIILGLGNQTALIVIGSLGIVLSFLAAHFLGDPKHRSYKEYRFTLISIICSCIANLLFGLALNDQFNLLNEFDYLIKLVFI